MFNKLKWFNTTLPDRMQKWQASTNPKPIWHKIWQLLKKSLYFIFTSAECAFLVGIKKLLTNARLTHGKTWGEDQFFVRTEDPV